jgi:predicted 3-demethylubiquinone-9 3-methyltransferase (glyoxalase superfamily)
VADDRRRDDSIHDAEDPEAIRAEDWREEMCTATQAPIKLLRQCYRPRGWRLKGNDMQKITPCLWFDNQAEEAAKFYVSIFKNSKIGNMTRYGEAGAEVSGRPKGSVMTVTFEIEGQEFVALNGGPHFTFSEAISLMVQCETQQDIDEMWEKLSHGGEEGPCGWLKDKYGLSWQIVSPEWNKMLRDKDVEKSERVMKAILQMTKPDIKTLKLAYDGI